LAGVELELMQDATVHVVDLDVVHTMPSEGANEKAGAGSSLAESDAIRPITPHTYLTAVSVERRRTNRISTEPVIHIAHGGYPVNRLGVKPRDTRLAYL